MFDAEPKAIWLGALADAPALLACYQRHYSSYLGSFAPTRTLQRQEHLLSNWFEVTDAQALVALSPEQRLDGYLMVSWKRHRLYAYEVAADTWLRVLVPFVAALLLRGPDFEKRFQQRLAGRL